MSLRPEWLALIYTCYNSPIDFKLYMIIPITVTYNPFVAHVRRRGGIRLNSWLYTSS